MEAYVSKSELLKEFKKRSILPAMLRRVIEEMPSEDVELVRYAHWKKMYVFDHKLDQHDNPFPTKLVYECSVCERQEERREPYCNCGCKMIDEIEDCT